MCTTNVQRFGVSECVAPNSLHAVVVVPNAGIRVQRTTPVESWPECLSQRISVQAGDELSIVCREPFASYNVRNADATCA